MDRSDVVAMIERAAKRSGVQIATAESLTGGLVAADLVGAPGSASWFRGGVVAGGADGVERDVLLVRPGPVVSEQTTIDMADGVALLLGATAAVAVTGELFPTDHETLATVWVAVRSGEVTIAEMHRISGEPDLIRSKSCALALWLLLRGITEDGIELTG